MKKTVLIFWKSLYVDTHIEELYKVSLMEISKKMKLKYQEQFHFIVKEEQ